MAHPMTKDISVRIREQSGLTLTKFAAHHKIDYASLKSFISGNCTGQSEKSKANKVKKKLLELGIITDKDIFAMTEPAKIHKKKIQKDKIDRRKIIARLRRKYQQSVYEYIDKNNDYFEKNNIHINLFRSFIAGIGTGTRKGTKSYLIRKLLEHDGLIKPFFDNEKENGD